MKERQSQTKSDHDTTSGMALVRAHYDTSHQILCLCGNYFS
jgi:hypothetical protein